MRLSFLAISIFVYSSLYAQSSTKVTIVPQQNDSATGVIDFREKYANGTNYVGWQAPANISSSFRLTLPSSLPTVAGCWQVSTSGITSIGTCASAVIASDYTWSQTIASITAGTRTITLAPCPLNASDTTWAFRVNDGVSSEVVFPTGIGTCTTGAATGTVQAIFLNSYTVPVASSASGGVQEAVNSVAAGNAVTVRVKDGVYSVYSDIVTGSRMATIVCDSRAGIFAPAANNVNVFNIQGASGGGIYNCSFNNGFYSKSGTIGILVNNTTGSPFEPKYDNNSFSGLSIGIDFITAYAATVSNNLFSDETTAELRIVNVSTGDAGAGTFINNIFSNSIGTAHCVLWNGPGNFKFIGNSINGCVEQLHLEPKMGVVNVSGTAVTWVSGNKFRTNWPIGSGFTASNTVASTIASITDDTHLVLNTSAPVCNSCSYYVGVSSQVIVSENTFDAGSATTHGVRLSGGIPFYSFQINNNFFSNWAGTTHTGVTVDGAGWFFGSIKANNMISGVQSSTFGVNLTAGNFIDVDANQFYGHNTGAYLGASAATVTATNNVCGNALTTNCVLSAASTAIVQAISPMTFAQVTAMTAAAGSTMFCTDCKAAPTTNACVGSGSGAFVTFVQATKICRNANNPGAQFVFGGNSFGTTGIIGTNDAFGLGFKTNNTTHWTMQTDGTLYTATDGGPSIGAGGANRPLNGYFKGLVQAGTFGTAANCSDGTATPADCAAAAAGSVIISAGATAVVVNTTAVTAASQILVLFDSSLGTKLGVTCNTTYAAPYVTARTAATSFTITVAGAPAANPACFSYFLAN